MECQISCSICKPFGQVRMVSLKGLVCELLLHPHRLLKEAQIVAIFEIREAGGGEGGWAVRLHNNKGQDDGGMREDRIAGNASECHMTSALPFVGRAACRGSNGWRHEARIMEGRGRRVTMHNTKKRAQSVRGKLNKYHILNSGIQGRGSKSLLLREGSKSTTQGAAWRNWRRARSKLGTNEGGWGYIICDPDGDVAWTGTTKIDSLLSPLQVYKLQVSLECRACDSFIVGQMLCLSCKLPTRKI